LKCQSALASIAYRLTTFGLTDPPPAINAANSLLGTIGTSPVIYDSPRGRKGGDRPTGRGVIARPDDRGCRIARLRDTSMTISETPRSGCVQWPW
jgi:hypothetical protein